MYKMRLFFRHIAEIRAIRCCFRVLVGRAVANGLLDLIGCFFPTGILPEETLPGVHDSVILAMVRAG
jgi:hypothetical protein